jgi:hypothetical protein
VPEPKFAGMTDAEDALNNITADSTDEEVAAADAKISAYLDVLRARHCAAVRQRKRDAVNSLRSERSGLLPAADRRARVALILAVSS